MEGQSYSKYQGFAGTIDFVPSLREKDNAMQFYVVLITTLLGLLIELWVGNVAGPFFGLFEGMIAGTLFSGAILTMRGLAPRFKFSDTSRWVNRRIHRKQPLTRRGLERCIPIQ